MGPNDYNDNFQDIEDALEFYEAIDLGKLRKTLSEDRPFVYWTMEVYDEKNGIKGGGGLGVLAADTRRVAQELEVPLVVVTPFFRSELHQSIDGLYQNEWKQSVSPDDHGFNFIDNVHIKTLNGADSELSIFVKELGSTKFVTISEPNFGELYSGDGSGDHRLYQEVSLGFGGYKALKRVGIKPAVIQLNETATIFAAVARLDELCRNGMNLYEAIVYVRKHTLYTNHTLLQGAEGEFSRDQFERFVMPNIKSNAVKRWIADQFTDGRLRLSTLAIEMAESKSGVSKLHARVADFYDRNGDKVKFHSVTNGIDIKTWVLPAISDFYKERDILDKFSLPTENYQQQIDTVTASDIKRLKNLGRQEMNSILANRKNQYGLAVELPYDATVFDFKRRFASYKRPFMLFEDTERLKSILSQYNGYLLMAGKVHQGDKEMYNRLHEILKKIEKDQLLKERIHFLQDYDEELGKALAIGADIAINIPIIGLEACGTSWEKDIANLKILISTSDGGVADVEPPACLQVTGTTYEAEVESLYEQMQRAGDMNINDLVHEQFVRKQLKAYLPTISGSRMVRDYLKYVFNK
jgi:alpha-glucan phosphorylase-like protein